MKHEFRVIQGCPAPKLIAPFIAIVVDDAHAIVDSIYRGDDARAILNAQRPPKHSQYQLYHATPVQRIAWHVLGQPDEPGFSSHEQKSDGSINIVHMYGVPRGGDLPWWGVGFDVEDIDTDRCIKVAQQHGWVLYRPYPGGSEHHHLNFRFKPVAHGLKDRAREIRLRATLPRS